MLNLFVESTLSNSTKELVIFLSENIASVRSNFSAYRPSFIIIKLRILETRVLRSTSFKFTIYIKFISFLCDSKY